MIGEKVDLYQTIALGVGATKWAGTKVVDVLARVERKIAPDGNYLVKRMPPPNVKGDAYSLTELGFTQPEATRLVLRRIISNARERNEPLLAGHD